MHVGASGFGMAHRQRVSMPRKLGPKLILSLTILIVAISTVSGYLNFRTQKRQLVETMVLGADELSRSITSATWQFMLDDDRRVAYQIMQTIADKEGVDRIRMFNREGHLVFSTDPREQPKQSVPNLTNEVCATCHNKGPITDKPAQASRVRYASMPEGVKTISMITPIYDEPSCSNASCHAHKASTKVLGVVDVALRLDPVRQQTRTITLQTIGWTLLEVVIGAAFVILFTRRFVGTPIRQLIKGTKAVSEMDLDQHIEITQRSQELDELVDSFNRMRERLKLAVTELNDMQQTRRSKPQRAPADLNKLVRTTVNLAQHKLKLLSTEIVLDLQETLPQVECDSSQMQQVVLNLVLNGAQAMQPKGGGTLTIRTRLIKQENSVELTVRDTGEGIAPGNLSKIFDPFFTTKADGKGVGLGLAVLYGIVKAHDGEVEVTSQKNVGTTFHVTVPLKSRKSDSEIKELQVQAV